MIGKKNVLLEGISDYYFLLGMAEYLKISDKVSAFSFIPGKGASQMHFVASILIGWGQDFVAVVDNDKAGKGAHKNLRELSVDEDRILQTSSQAGAAIEDLFSYDDFTNQVIPSDFELKVVEDKSNSQNIKNKADKVILAKLLIDKIRSEDAPLKLSQETTDNFMELFKKIMSAFGETKRIKSIKPAANDVAEEEKTGS